MHTTPRILRALMLALAIASPALAANSAPSPLPIGAPMPAATATLFDLDGRATSLSSLTGPKGTLVIFTGNYCAFSKAWESRITELSNAYYAKGIGVVLINSNNPALYAEDGLAGMRARKQARGLLVPYVVDPSSDVARAFFARVTPEAFLFDAGGALVYHGAVDDKADAAKVTASYLRDALDAILAGRKPSFSETPSIGCGIKFREPAPTP